MTDWAIDKSALMRLGRGADVGLWIQRVERGLVRISTVTLPARSRGVPDLLVAAIGELAGLTVLHDDKDFELIAAVTGQPTERLAGG